MLLMIEEVGMPELMEEILEDCIDLVNFFIHFSYFYIFVILITFYFFFRFFQAFYFGVGKFFNTQIESGRLFPPPVH